MEKLAGDKLLKLPVKPFFTKGQVKLLDILNVDYMEKLFKVRQEVENPSEIYRGNEIFPSLSCAVLKFSKATKA